MSATGFGRIAELPRIHIAIAPTPLEPLPRLSEAAGGAMLSKRDDLLPIAFGGNKVRQLEFYFGAAKAEGADTVLITGAVQSNYCRTTAAIAAKLGMECHIQAEERVPGKGAEYHRQGNMLVQRLLGARVHGYPDGEDEAGADAELGRIAERLRAEGRRPYLIPLGPGHPPTGALGYVLAAQEIADQAADAGVARPHIVTASGSGATHSGLLFGIRALGLDWPVTGVCVRRLADLQGPRIARRCEGIAALLGTENPVAESDIRFHDRFLAPGYGRLNLPTEHAIRLAARTEALILDPVYSGKSMAGAINIASNADPETTVIFVHTGGQPGLFAYGEEMMRIAEGAA